MLDGATFLNDGEKPKSLDSTELTRLPNLPGPSSLQSDVLHRQTLRSLDIRCVDLHPTEACESAPGTANQPVGRSYRTLSWTS